MPTASASCPSYDPRAELAPRDIVSQAIVDRMWTTQHPCVYLDLSPLDPAHALRRFPGIAKSCAEFGIDITRDRIPVRPGAHYMIGGVTVDHEGRTTLPGLWAAGEVTSSGLHGANRLASNSLLEGLVYGAHAGAGASAAALAMPDSFQAIPLENPALEPSGEPLDLLDIRNSLKSLMWRAAGVRRDGKQLAEAAKDCRPMVPLRAVAAVCRPRRLGTAEHADRGPGDDRSGPRAARNPGASTLRSDFPDSGGPAWRRHLAVTGVTNADFGGLFPRSTANLTAVPAVASGRGSAMDRSPADGLPSTVLAAAAETTRAQAARCRKCRWHETQCWRDPARQRLAA